MKIVRRGALPVGGDSGLAEVRERAQRRVRRAGSGAATVEKLGRLARPSSSSVLSFVDESAIQPLRIVIDAANGMAGAMLPPVLERLPIDAVRCFFEPDGSFPNHEPNPLLPENREFIVAQDARGGRRPRGRVRRRRRPLLLRRRHGRVRARATSSRRCWPSRSWRRSPARRSSTTCARAGRCRRRSSAAGGEALVNRVGHAFIKHRMREEDAAFARRGVGPLLLPRLLPGRLGRRPVPAHARARRRRRGRKLSELLAPFRERYFITGELNTPVADVDARAAGAEGAVRARGRGLAPRRRLGRRPRTGTSTCARRTPSRSCA